MVYLQRHAALSFLHSLHFVKFSTVQIFTAKKNMNSSAFKANVHLNIVSFASLFFLFLYFRHQRRQTPTARPPRSQTWKCISERCRLLSKTFSSVCFFCFKSFFFMFLYNRAPIRRDSGRLSFLSSKARDVPLASSQAKNSK